jgi:transglutaminase-like putative cysteine protease
MDFSAWFEVYLGGRWYTFDARHNHPRIGRIEMATSAASRPWAIRTSFGPSWLTTFTVVTEEVVPQDTIAPMLVPGLAAPSALQIA